MLAIQNFIFIAIPAVQTISQPMMMAEQVAIQKSATVLLMSQSSQLTCFSLNMRKAAATTNIWKFITALALLLI